ncbi:MAG: Si-specific NAD(P)(+) transhydrogenase [Gammaproteobacteria bacterium]|nr:Si-specific NAD(P)(+) transhydrogenase [Gammaproteobacteria bacterium]
METPRYDAVIIGSGPAGEGATMAMAKAGRRVAMVERHTDVGGGCTHWGTIPSKALRHAVRQISDFKADPLLRRLVGRVTLSYPELLHSAQASIRMQVDTREGFYYRNHVDIYPGEASFLDPHTLLVRQSSREQRVEAEHVVIATGSSPYHPEDVDFSHARIHDSDSILRLDFSPRTITIFGAGVIGCEYASIFTSLGVKVNLINTRSQLLSFLDAEITDALGYHLRNQGVVIWHDEEYARVVPSDDDVTTELRSGKRVKTDVLLWANGRSGNTGRLGLENIGVAVNSRGQIEVNESYQTVQPHVYAVGDVVGWPSLASASYDQGRFAGLHIARGVCDEKLVHNIPTGIYTSPEISSIGPTERELTEQKIPYEIGRAFFRNIARAQITAHTVGMLKILFHTETLEILGIHCFGDQAAEIIHIGQAIMAQSGGGNSVRYFVETTFNYPTMAEAYRVAALNGLNRLR